MFVDNTSANAEGTPIIQSVAKDTTIYVEPSVESTVIGQIAKGSYVTATPVSEEWTRIKTQQLEGYVETAALVSLKSEKYVVTKKMEQLYLHTLVQVHKKPDKFTKIVLSLYMDQHLEVGHLSNMVIKQVMLQQIL